METIRKDKKNKSVVAKVARSVRFNTEQLSDKVRVTKARERYIKSVTAKALTAISA